MGSLSLVVGMGLSDNAIKVEGAYLWLWNIAAFSIVAFVVFCAGTPGINHNAVHPVATVRVG